MNTPGFSQKGIAHILLLILLVAGIVLGIYLVQNRTNIFPHASVSDPIAPKTGFTLTSANESISPGGEFYVKVTANSDFDPANLFTLVLNYPADKVEMTSIVPAAGDTDQTGTFIKKWIEQSDDKNGKLTLSGAVPNPGFKTEVGNPASMVIIRFRVKPDLGGLPKGDIPLIINDESGIYRNSDNQNIISNNTGVTVNIGTGAVASPSPVFSDHPGKLGLRTITNSFDPGCALPIVIDFDTGGRNVDGVDAILKFDQNLITISSVSDGTVFKNNFNSIDNSRGKAMISGLPPGKGSFNGRGILATVNFVVNPNVSKGTKVQVSFDFDPNNLDKTTDSNIVEQATIKELLGEVGLISIVIGGDGSACLAPLPSPIPPPPTVDGKRADLFKDSKKPNFINDQDISVFFSKCAEKGVELFGQPASVRPVCDIFEDGKITVQDWAVLIKFRNQQI